METTKATERTLLLWTLLISSLIGIAIWYGRRLIAAPPSGWFSATIVTFSYFTTATNALVIVMAAALLRGRGRLAAWFGQPAVLAACCLYIAFVGLGFWLLLGGPSGIESWLLWIPEVTAHTLSPILGVVLFLRHVPRGTLRGLHAFSWLLYPLAYLLYWLLRGPLVGYYPYFFIDVNALGYGGVARWSGILLVTYLLLGAGMVLYNRRGRLVSAALPTR